MDAEEVLVVLLSLTLVLLLTYIKAFKIQPSAVVYIAQSTALVGKGEWHKTYENYDMARTLPFISH